MFSFQVISVLSWFGLIQLKDEKQYKEKKTSEKPLRSYPPDKNNEFLKLSHTVWEVLGE